MDYDTFKTYLITFLWKTGDQDLIDNLDTLVTMGTHELNRVLDLSRRNTGKISIAVSSAEMDLPYDFRNMVYFGDSNGGFANVTLWALNNTADLTSTTSGFAPVYHTSGGKLFTKANSYPQDAYIQYRTNLPDFAATNESWMADEYLDVYTYTVLKHAAPFLREDERIPVWANFSNIGIGSMIEEDKHRVEFGGSPLEIQVVRPIP